MNNEDFEQIIQKNFIDNLILKEGENVEVLFHRSGIPLLTYLLMLH